MSTDDPGSESAQNTAPIQRDVIPRDAVAFYRDLSIELKHATKSRNIEQRLYPPIHRLLSKHAETITPADSESVILTVQEQRSFKKEDDIEASESKFTVNNVEFELPTEIPDFVRMFLNEEIGDADKVLVDFVEVKPLKTDLDWNTSEAREMAEDEIKASLFQLYRQAMSGFFYHPEWTCVYGILVVGVYFSLFRWRRQKGKEFEASPPVEYDFNSFPAEPISPEAHQALVDVLEAAIKECSSRWMPKIICWNQPMFDFHGPRNHPTNWFSRVTLTEELLWALRQPLKEHKGTKYRLSFFSAPGKKPWRINRDIRDSGAVDAVYEILSADPLKRLKEYHEVYTQESASTTSQKRNETRSFGPDDDYAPPSKAKKAARKKPAGKKATGANPAPRASRPQRKKRGAADVPVGACVESASAHVGMPPNS